MRKLTNIWKLSKELFNNIAKKKYNKVKILIKYINAFNYFIFHLLIAEHIFFLKKSKCASECSFMREHTCIAFYVYVFIHAYINAYM